MRRRRLILALLVLVVAGLVYLTQEPEPAAPRPIVKQPYVDLRVPGMELRAGPATSAPPTPAPPTPESRRSARETGR